MSLLATAALGAAEFAGGAAMKKVIGWFKKRFGREPNEEEKGELLEIFLDHAKEVTKRHKQDMVSDSWLSKNIRPLVLLYMVVTLPLIPMLPSFTPTTPEHVVEIFDIYKWWGGAGIIFYYGSKALERAVEKSKFGK